MDKMEFENEAAPAIIPKIESSPEPAILEEEDTHLDTIDSLADLKSDLAVLQLNDWKVECLDSNLYFYKLIVEPNGNLKVQISIHIDSELFLRIFYKDKELGFKFSKPTIHKCLKVKGWCQLQKLLDKCYNVQDIKIYSQKIVHN